MQNFSLNKKQLNLRIALVETIRGHVEERGLTRKQLSDVLDSLQFTLDDIDFLKMEINQSDLTRDEQQQWDDARFSVEKEKDE